MKTCADDSRMHIDVDVDVHVDVDVDVDVNGCHVPVIMLK